MKKTLTRLSACLLAAAVTFSGAGISTFAAGQAEQTVQTQATQNPIGWNYINNSFTLTYSDNTQAKSTYVQTSGNVTIKNGTTKYTLKKGIYFFNSKGVLDLKPSGLGIKTVQSVNSGYARTSKAKYVLNISACTKKGNTYASGITYFTGKYNGKIYKAGKPYSGVADVDGTMYRVSNGKYSKSTKYTGLLKTSYVSTKAKKTLSATNLYYKSGKKYSGIVGRKWYKKGKFQKVTGWKKINNAIYYLQKGVAVTGWNRLKSYSGGSSKYKYYFKKNGRLVTDLFSLKRSYYIKQNMKIRVNLTTHNTTFYIYNNQTKAYDIPALSAVCSTSRTYNGTKPGHFRLEKTSARKWFIYKKSNPWHYYQYGVHIKGSKSWFHSTMYRTTNKKSLIVTGSSGYNRLGTNQTTACIRHQAGVAKLIYDISTKTNKKARVWVDIYRSSNKGPFGKITLSDTTGKLKSSQKYDPTDPSFK